MNKEEFKDAFHEYTLLKHARFDREKVIWNWDFIDLKDELIRVYYKTGESDTDGFFFYVAHEIGSLEMDTYFDVDNTVVECLFQGYAYYDGFRHLYMGSEQHDNKGYLYYPDLKSYIKVFEVLLELERKHCNIS